MSYNIRQSVDYIGFISEKIDANHGLPSIKQTLAVLFFHLRKLSKTLDQSAKSAVTECLVFWKEAEIPTQKEFKCVQKLKNEYEKWRNMQKSASKQNKSDIQLKKEKEYEENLNELFDIASSDALETISEQARNLLLHYKSKPFFLLFLCLLVVKKKFFFSKFPNTLNIIILTGISY